MIEFITGLTVGGFLGMFLSGLLRDAADIDIEIMKTPDDIYREVQQEIEREKFNDR